MLKSVLWFPTACIVALAAAPALAQQTSPAPAQANPPMFKEPLTTANLFPRKKNKVMQAQPVPSPQMPSQAQPQPRAAPFKQRFFDKLDTNNDGIVSHDEFLAQANRQFNALDLNHDGRLTSDEISAAVAKADANAATPDVPVKRKALTN